MGALALFGDSPVSLRMLGTILGLTDTLKVDSLVERLSYFGLVRVENQRISTHPLLREFIVQRVPSGSPSTSGTLYITVDPSLMGKEDFVEVLDTLNAIYAHLGGDELLIREDEIGRFTKAGVLV